VNDRVLDVVVVGGANTDYLVRGQSLPGPGSTVDGDEFQEASGGKGANQAVAAARLGARVAFVARVGADARGRAIVATLESEGVDVRQVITDDDARTGVALVMVDAGGEKQIMTAPGANHRLTVDDIARARDVITAARVLLIQLEVPLDAIESAAHLGRSAGALVVLDPAPPRPLPERLLRQVHVIRPNAAEAEAITGIRVSDELSARDVARHLMERGAGAAIVGAPGGNLLATSDEELWVPHTKVEAVDSTGAGDAFAAAVAVSLSRDEPLRSAVRFASAAAAAKTRKLGAQAGLPSREEVLQLLSAQGTRGVAESRRAERR
jgi:ribokinase